LSRHKSRDTWETQGGHIENGETPLDAAKRELYEESGIVDAELFPVCDYYGYNSKSFSHGMVFLAVVHSLGDLPESEIGEVRAFDTIPENLTYPQTSPKLYAEAQKLLVSMPGRRNI
ncbi:MAG: NUDIX domain-containing protein, partial [Clostridia bacterium]|nr:NUDIX domain-containing protein [Clostridia bacterium]